MNETGLPAPFIDMTMLSPALRTSQIPACADGSVAATTASKAEISHQLAQALQLQALLVRLVARKLDQQQGIPGAAHEALDQGPVGGDLAAELEDRAIDQLDRRGRELDDRLGRHHGVMKVGK